MPEGAYFDLQIAKSAFVDVLGDSSSFLRRKFRRWDPLKYGQLSGKIDTQLKSFILELINSKGQLVESVRNKKSFHFSGLKSDTYHFRLVEDRNKDGKWNSGTLLLNTPPEQVHLLPPRLSIRENWLLENIQLQLPTKK